MDGQADRIVAPGQTEQIKLTINTSRKRKGKFTKSVRVNTNDAKNQNPTLMCEGFVKVPFEMQPATVNFSQIERGSEAQRKTITITRGDTGSLALELMPVEHENVKVTLREVEQGELYELDVELVPPWPNRAIQAYLTVKTGVEEVPEEKIRVYARVAPRLRANPSRFTIPRTMQSDLDLKARLRWSGGDPGEVLEVTSSDTNLTASFEETGAQQVVMLHVPKDYAFPSRSRHFVTVRTDDKDAPLLRIQISAAAARPAKLTEKPGKPTLRRLPGPPPGIKPLQPGAKPTFGAVRPTKPGPDKAKESTKEKPAEATDQPTKSAEKPAKPPERPADKPD